MRLDTDVPHQPQSPTQSYSNGSSTRSPGAKTALGKVANGNSHIKTDSNGSAGSYANGTSNRKPVSPTFFGHNREEVTRILIQSLTDLGYDNAARALCQESGYELEGPTVAAFRSAVLQGEWAEAEVLLFGTDSYDDGGGVGLGEDGAGYGKGRGKATKHSWSPQRHTKGLKLAEGANENEMKFWMRQQKYLELLEERDLGAALMVLRQELTPLHQDVGRLHALSRYGLFCSKGKTCVSVLTSISSLMMCQSAEDLKYQASWDGAAGESRRQLLSELSSKQIWTFVLRIDSH